jgi:hypothetical protein
MRRRAVLAVAATALACSSAEPPPPPEVVAQVDGAAVRYAEFEDYVTTALGEPGASLGSDVLSRLFDQFIEERLLTRLAVERGLLAADEADGRFGGRRALDLLLADAARGAASGALPSESEIAAWYDANRERYRRPERVRLRQILVEDRRRAERLRREIVGGADFAAVAADASQDPTVAAATGPQGEFSRAELPRSFAEVIFELAPGEVSEVVEAEYGFHIFQVEERLDAELLPLAAVRDDVERRLLQEAADHRLGELAAEARGRYDVTVWERNLPFNYRGVYGAKSG